MARIDSAYLPGPTFAAGKLNLPSASLTTVMVVVPPSRLALTSTPSMAPSSCEATWPESAAGVCALRLCGEASATARAIAGRTTCMRMGFCSLSWPLLSCGPPGPQRGDPMVWKDIRFKCPFNGHRRPGVKTPLKSSADRHAGCGRANWSDASARCLSHVRSFRSRRLRADLEIPVEDLLPGPEQHVALLADGLEDAMEILGPVRCAHDVGMHRNRHDAGGALGVGVDLFELIDGAIVEFRRLVVLDQHHGDVVAFLRVGHTDDRLAASLQPHRLVVEHPIGDIVVALLAEDIGRLPGLREAGAEPAARAPAGHLGDELGGLADVLALVRDLLHVALGQAVSDELPFALDRRLHDLRIGGDGAAVDVHHARNFKFVVDLE